MEENKFDFSKAWDGKKICKEDIFENYDQVALFEKYFGSSIDFKKSYKNRLRSDRKPNCKFKYRNGTLKFFDWAASKSYDVIQWVMDDYNLNYFDAIKKISEDFKFNKNIKPIHKPYEIEEDKIEFIQIQPKSYSEQFVNYFRQYLITEKTCQEDNVYCVNELFINNEKWYLRDNELCIAYYFPDIDKIKILRPYVKDYKWRTNAPNTYIDGLSELTDEVDYVILLKSKKEKMLIKQLGYKNVLSTQMEGKFVITEETEERIKGKKKILWMDGDKTGREVSEYYKELGWNPIYFDSYFYDVFGITDPTDYTKEFQSTDLIKKLINEKIN